MDDVGQPEAAAATPPAAPPAAAPGGNGAGESGGAEAPAQGWYDSARPQTQNPGMDGEQIPKQTMPVPVTSLKRGGLLGVVDSIADVLAGKQRPELGKDPDGNLYVKQHDMTRGEQWMKIAGEGLRGAAAGLAAGKGAGNMGKAPLAGIQAQQEQQEKEKQDLNDQADQETKLKMAKANNQMLQMKMAQQVWQQARDKVKAGQEDVTFNDSQIKQLTDAGGKVIGTATHPGDIGDILKVQPDVMAHLVQKGTIQIKKNMDEDGNVTGIKAILMPDEWAKTTLPPGATGHMFNPVSGEIETFNYSDPVTQGEQAVHDAAAVTAKDEFDAKQRKAQQDAAGLEKTEQETKTSKAEETKVPSEIEKNEAEAGKDVKEGEAAAQKAGDASDPALIKMIGTGQMPAGRLSYLLARNPALTAAVAQAYPGFDGSKVEAYTRAYADFTSGKTSQELLSGGTALEHLKELNDLNTNASHIYGTPAYTAYQNKADTVATELAKFYGDSTIPAIAQIKKTLTSTLPGNRKSAIETQAGSMADRLDNYAQKWANAAPSEAYEAAMPGISTRAKDAWASLDPKYASRTAATIFTKQAPAQQVPGSGKSISLAAAMALPEHRGQSAEQVTAAAKKLGYAVNP